MSSVSRLFLFCSAVLGILSSSEESFARTRAPANSSEKSLLYWRYLCRQQPQTDVVKNGRRELSCSTQGWKVRTSVESDRVTEVNEDER